MQETLVIGNLKQQDALKFILGGNALFTVKRTQTGQRFTYKVLIDKAETSLRVYLLSGPDNTANYKRIGEIVYENYMPTFKANVYTRGTDATDVFDVIFLNLSIKLDMPGVEFWHSGRCCRCGRILTVPESIENGIGPECITLVPRFTNHV